MWRSGQSPRWAADHKPQRALHEREQASGSRVGAEGRWRVEPTVDIELGDWTVDMDFVEVLSGALKHSLWSRTDAGPWLNEEAS